MWVRYCFFLGECILKYRGPWTGQHRPRPLLLELARGYDKSLPCLGLKSYCSDGTRTKLRFCLHIFAHPDSRRGVSRKSLFVIVEPHSNIQKKSLEEKGVNIVVCPFSSHDKTVVHKSISKKHTNRYLTSTNHLISAMARERPSRSARATFH